MLTHEIKLSMDVSMGLVLRDLRNEARPGVKATDVEGILRVDCIQYEACVW